MLDWCADSSETADRVRGYLTVTVAEASGVSKEDEIVWEDHFREGFVKGETCNVFTVHLWPFLMDTAAAVEVRGGPRNIKVCAITLPCLCMLEAIYLPDCH